MFVGSADADVVESAVVADGDGACFVDAVVSDSEMGCVACLARFGFGEPVVDGGGCGASEGSVGSVVVVVMRVIGSSGDVMRLARRVGGGGCRRFSGDRSGLCRRRRRVGGAALV